MKVVHSGIVSIKNPGKITSGGFTREELRCLVEEAQQYGLPVHCHVNSDPSIREAASFRSLPFNMVFYFRRNPAPFKRKKHSVDPHPVRPGPFKKRSSCGTGRGAGKDRGRASGIVIPGGPIGGSSGGRHRQRFPGGLAGSFFPEGTGAF